jgi:hypothetical protein
LQPQLVRVPCLNLSNLYQSLTPQSHSQKAHRVCLFFSSRLASTDSTVSFPNTTPTAGVTRFRVFAAVRGFFEQRQVSLPFMNFEGSTIISALHRLHTDRQVIRKTPLSFRYLRYRPVTDSVLHLRPIGMSMFSVMYAPLP